MDIQLLIVIICIAAAVYYFVRRMYRSVRSGKCACCDDSSSREKRGCSCGCGGKGRAVVTQFNVPTRVQSTGASVVMEKTVAVQGMMCANCEAHVKQALEALDGVVSAVASHTQGTVKVSLCKDVPDNELEQAISAAGYTFQGIITRQN